MRGNYLGHGMKVAAGGKPVGDAGTGSRFTGASMIVTELSVASNTFRETMLSENSSYAFNNKKKTLSRQQMGNKQQRGEFGQNIEGNDKRNRMWIVD